ncbi:hypothetical protein ABPG72_017129 [Tetrahymena utriculariae]
MQPKALQTNPLDVSIAQTELSQIEKTKYQKADWSEAQRQVKKYQILDKSSGEPKPFSLSCDLSCLKKYSIGIYFYFDLLKKIAIFFWIATLICAPTYYSNFSGGGITNTSGLFSLSQFSLANQPQLQLTIPSSTATQSEKQQVQQQNDQSIRDFVSSQSTRKYYVWIPDIVYSSLFFLFILYYKRFSTNQINAQKKMILPSQYCVEIKGLPRNTVDQNELKVFIQKVMQKYTNFGDQLTVMEISFSKDFKDTLYLHRKEAELIEQISIEKKKCELLNKDYNYVLKEKELKLKVLQEKIDVIVTKKLGGNAEYKFYETLSAFVVFNTFEQKKQFTELYNSYNHPHWIYRYILCCLRPRMPSNLKFRGLYSLQIYPIVDEPSNIKWENLDVKSGNRFFRAIIVFLIILCVMLMTLSTLIVANVAQPKQQTSFCPSNKYTYEQAKQINTSQSQYCYCTTVSIKEMLSNSQIENYCWNTYLSYVEVQALTIATSSAIVIVNAILVGIIKKLSNFLRFPNVTTDTTTSTIILFICVFINTAILTLLLQSDIFGFITAVYFTSPIPPLKDLQSQKSQTFSADFDRDWYIKVGQKMILTMIFSTLFPHVIQLIVIPIKKCCRQRSAKKKIIQVEMNQLLVGDEFNLIARYTSFMNVVFVCLFYSSGQPLLLPCAAVSLTSQYWVFKYMLLRWHKKPPAYDQLLNTSMLKLIPWSLLLHLGIGIYMYGSPLIFPRSSTQISSSISDTLNSAGVYEVVITSNQNSPVIDRTYSSLYLFFLLALILAFYIADVAILKIISTVLSKILPCFFRNSQSLKVAAVESADPLQNTYANQYKSMGQLASYDIKMNENYYALITAIDHGSQSNTPRSVGSPSLSKGLGFGDTLKMDTKKSKFVNNNNNFNLNTQGFEQSNNQLQQRQQLESPDNSPQMGTFVNNKQ